jgi:hypothetical protein
MMNWHRLSITGIGGCCADAASGQSGKAAAAPPSRVMNSCRLSPSPRRRAKQIERDAEPEHLGSLEIDDKRVFVRPLDG